MHARRLAVGLCLMLFCSTAFALIETIFVRFEFGFSYFPGAGDFLTLDGGPWSLDDRVSFVSKPEGSFLRVVFTDTGGGTPSGIAAYPANLGPNPKINCLSMVLDCDTALAFIPITGPPHSIGQVEERLIEAIPEPSMWMFLVAAIAAAPLVSRRLRSVSRADSLGAS